MEKFSKVIAALMLVVVVVFAAGCKKQDPVKPEVETSNVSNITETSATGGGVVTSDGGSSIIERGVCWSKECNPEVSDNHLIVGGGTGSFTCNLTNLEPNTTYYLKAYAINSAGIAYGSKVSFVTLQDGHLPIVSISEASEITTNSAKFYGLIHDDGGSSIVKRGFCWSRNHNPTLDDSSIDIWYSDDFYGYIYNLELNTTYYVRAYAINSDGIGYSSEVSFSTLNPPTISVLTGVEYIGDGDILDVDVEYEFGFEMAFPEGLSSLVIKADDYEFDFVDLSGMTSYTYVNHVMFSVEREIIGDCTFTAIVTGINGHSSTASFKVFVNVNPHPLITYNFTWYRMGNTSTGLEEFGLYWESNSKGIYAQIKPLEGVSMYWLDPFVWDVTITEEEKATLLANAIENYLPIPVYNYVDVSLAHSDYNHVIATIKPDGTFHLIHVTRCDVSIDYYGSAITITGEAK